MHHLYTKWDSDSLEFLIPKPIQLKSFSKNMLLAQDFID